MIPKVHVFDLTPQHNGGESILLRINYLSYDDEIEVLNHILTLQSYQNSASFNLSGGAITPENLRDLADQLERLGK